MASKHAVVEKKVEKKLEELETEIEGLLQTPLDCLSSLIIDRIGHKIEFATNLLTREMKSNPQECNNKPELLQHMEILQDMEDRHKVIENNFVEWANSSEAHDGPNDGLSLCLCPSSCINEGKEEVRTEEKMREDDIVEEMAEKASVKERKRGGWFCGVRAVAMAAVVVTVGLTMTTGIGSVVEESVYLVPT